MFNKTCLTAEKAYKDGNTVEVTLNGGHTGVAAARATLKWQDHGIVHVVDTESMRVLQDARKTGRLNSGQKVRVQVTDLSRFKSFALDVYSGVEDVTIV